MVFNFDFQAYFDELKATKPPYKCPFKDCQKVYKTYSGIQYHVIMTHKNGHGAKNGPSKATRWHHRQLRSPMTPPKSVSSIENGSLDDKDQIYDNEQDRESTINVKIGDKMHKLINESDDIPVIIHSTNETIVSDMDSTSMIYPFRNVENYQNKSDEEDSIIKQPPKKPIPFPSFKLVKDYSRISKNYPVFRMPSDDYIKFNNGSDVKNETVDYCIDEEDKIWLKENIKECKVQIDETKLESVIDKLEKASYFVTRCENKSSHHNTSNSFHTISNNNNKPVDDNALCSICSDGSCTPNNTILFCDMCDMGVHQECYGVPYVPDGVWLCRRCLHSPSKELQCCLCPSPGGTLKQTVDGRWAHILCAAWVPEVHFANPVFLEPIDGLDTIPPARWRLMCFLCRRKRVGACIQCHRPNCYTAFHVSCAIYAGLHIKMKSRTGRTTSSGIFVSNHSAGCVRRTAYCDIHRPKVRPDGDEEDDDDADNNSTISASADNDDDYEPMSKAKVDMMMKKRSMMTKMVMMKMKKVVHVLSYPTIPDSCLKLISDELNIFENNGENNSNDDILDSSTNFMEILKNYWLLKRLSKNGIPLIRGLQPNLAPRNMLNQDVGLDSTINISNVKNNGLLYKRSFNKKSTELPALNIDDDEDEEEEEDDDVEKLFVQQPPNDDDVKVTKPTSIKMNSKKRKFIMDDDNDGEVDSHTSIVVSDVSETEKEISCPKKKAKSFATSHNEDKLMLPKLNSSDKTGSNLKQVTNKPNNSMTTNSSNSNKHNHSSSSNKRPKVNSSRLQYYADSFFSDADTNLDLTDKNNETHDMTTSPDVTKRSKRHRRLSSYLVDYTFFKSVKKRKLNMTSSSGDYSKISQPSILKNDVNTKNDTQDTQDLNADENMSDHLIDVNMSNASNKQGTPMKGEMSNNVRVHLSKVNLEDLKKTLKLNKKICSGDMIHNKNTIRRTVRKYINNNNDDDDDHDHDHDKNDQEINNEEGKNIVNINESVDENSGGVGVFDDDVIAIMKKLRNELNIVKKLLKMVRKREGLKMEHVKLHEKLLFTAFNPLPALLRNTLKQLQQKDHRQFFHLPVDVEDVPDYLDIVSTPMDFHTMNRKIDDNQYSSLKDFQRDFDLIINNCTLYNAKTTIYYQTALKLKQLSISIFTEAEDFELKLNVEVGKVVNLLKYSSATSSFNMKKQFDDNDSDKEDDDGVNDDIKHEDGDDDDDDDVNNAGMRQLENRIEHLKKKIDTTSCSSGRYLKEFKILHRKYTLLKKQSNYNKHNNCCKNNYINTNSCKSNNDHGNKQCNNIFQHTRSSSKTDVETNFSNITRNNKKSLTSTTTKPISTIKPTTTTKLTSVTKPATITIPETTTTTSSTTTWMKNTQCKQGNKGLKQLSLFQSFLHLQSNKEDQPGEMSSNSTTTTTSTATTTTTSITSTNQQPPLNNVCDKPSSTTLKMISCSKLAINDEIRCTDKYSDNDSPKKLITDSFKDKLKSFISANCIKQINNNNLTKNNSNNVNSFQKKILENQKIVFDFRPQLEAVTELQVTPKEGEVVNKTHNTIDDNVNNVNDTILSES